ncbi:MAG: DNA polymerase IV [Lachnospiraceae bacterium]|nr:DNA polymerase IV [Lachnospiraceae bacterium]
MDDRVIFHIDVNSAFLSWEAVYNLENGGTEDYREGLFAVGGDVETRHGIILAKSIKTKPYGVTTGEPVVNAIKKCPNLKLLKSHRNIYSQYSHAFINVLKDYSDCIEQFSIDEAFVDMTGTRLLFGEPLDAANMIRQRIRNELGFTVNVGVSSNKLLAKMASDFTKPDKTHTLFPEEVPLKMWPLPVSDLFFVGKNTAQKLNSVGIKTIGDLAHTNKEVLTGLFKKQGEYMWYAANGIDDSLVTPEHPDAKGYSHSTTLPYNVTEKDEAKMVLRTLTERVCERVREDNVKAQTVTVQLRFNDLTRSTHQCTLETPTNITDEIYSYVSKLFDEKWDGTPIRLLGVQASNVTSDDSFRQISLFDNTNYEKLEKLDKALDTINARYGRGSILRASNLKNQKEDS